MFGGGGRKFGLKNSRMDQLKIFKSCLSQILLGPFLNTLSHFYSSKLLETNYFE